MDNKARFEQAKKLLNDFKGDNYICGIGCIGQIGALVAKEGKRASIVIDGLGQSWGEKMLVDIKTGLETAGVVLCGEPIPGAMPNAPLEDVKRIARELGMQKPDVVIGAGGGSLIDSVKSAICYMVLGEKYPDFGTYFGMGMITKMLTEQNLKLTPMVAVQSAASSGAHLTKYSNITNTASWQKKLIIDEAVVPKRALFDYSYSMNMPKGFTADGALDGVSHALEVYFGATEATFERVRPVCTLAIELIVNNLERTIANPNDAEGREALGLGTDLGGLAIMIGGTNGAHLNSFSFVDVLSHGRACALMNPYYTVFFAPAIVRQLKDIIAILHSAGYCKTMPPSSATPRELGIAVATGMTALSKKIGFPTTLGEVNGFTDAHIEKALNAAKDPQLESKLKNMPVPLTAATVDAYMGSILQAAKSGDFSLVKEFK